MRGSARADARREWRRSAVLRRDLRLGEDHKGFGQDAVILHRVGQGRCLHRGHHDVHVGDVHEHRDACRVLLINERPYVGHAKGTEHLFALR